VQVTALYPARYKKLIPDHCI